MCHRNTLKFGFSLAAWICGLLLESTASAQAPPGQPVQEYIVDQPITPESIRLPILSPDELEMMMSSSSLNRILRANRLSSEDAIRFQAFFKMRAAEKVFEHPKASPRQKVTLRLQAIYALNALMRMDAKQYRPLFDQYVEKLVKTDPKSQAANFGRAQQFIADTNIGSNVPAENLAVKVMEFAKANKDNPNARLFLERAAKQLEPVRPAEAVAVLKTALELYPTDISTPMWGASIRRLQLPGTPMVLVGPKLDGTEFKMESLKGKVVLVYFWAIYSRQSINEFTGLKLAYDKLHARDFEIVAISIDRSRDAVERFVREKQVPGIQLFSPEYRDTGWDNPNAKKYGVIQVPSAFLIGKDGKVVRTKFTGENGIQTAIETELAK